MSNLRKLVEEYVDTTKKLGPEADKVDLSAERTKQLEEKLEALRSRNKSVFWLSVFMVLVVFAGCCVVTYEYLDDPDKLKLIFGAAGVSIMGLVYYMNALYRKAVSTEMLIALVTHLDAQGVNTVLTVLLQKL